MIGLAIVFFVLPFITYPSMASKIIFSTLWVLSCAFFVYQTIDRCKKSQINDKSRVAITVIFWIIFLALCFVNNNFYHLGDWWQIAIIMAMALYAVLMVYWLIKEIKRNPKGTLSALVMSILLIFGFLCILASNLTYIETESKNKILIIGIICIAIPIIALLVAKTLKISKAEKALEYGSFIILCIILLIGVSHVIYVLDPNVNGYETFVTLFASFLGGGLTLIGVAWTIQKSNHDRMEDDKKKAKPIFSFEMCTEPLSSVDGIKICLTAEKSAQYSCNVLALIENSDHSVFSIERVFHDGQWREACGNKVVLPNAKVYLDFNFNNDPKDLFMEIKDGMGTLYYYRIKVLVVPNKVDMSIPSFFHTVQGISEISFEEIEKKIMEK